jgi:hypothetical protein
MNRRICIDYIEVEHRYRFDVMALNTTTGEPRLASITRLNGQAGVLETLQARGA